MYQLSGPFLFSFGQRGGRGVDHPAAGGGAGRGFGEEGVVGFDFGVEGLQFADSGEHCGCVTHFDVNSSQ